jgi:hypothetical protein
MCTLLVEATLYACSQSLLIAEVLDVSIQVCSSCSLVLSDDDSEDQRCSGAKVSAWRSSQFALSALQLGTSHSQSTRALQRHARLWWLGSFELRRQQGRRPHHKQQWPLSAGSSADEEDEA